MKRVLFIAAAFAMTATAPAFAESERMTDSRYLAASTCLAYADHGALEGEGFDTAELRQAVSDNRYRVNSVIRERAEQRAEQIRRNRPTSDGGVQTLRDRRDETCASFYTQGLVQREGQAAS
jgi:type II secretory pathway component PulJ